LILTSLKFETFREIVSYIFVISIIMYTFNVLYRYI